MARIKRILITGANGFIGKNLSEYLENRYQVFKPTHQELDLLDETSVKNYLTEKKVEIILHCANVGGGRNTVHRKGVLTENLRMFFNLARNEGIFEKMIFLGSGAEYDMRHYKPKMQEKYFDTYTPLDDYGFSKYVCAKYIENSKNIINLRLFGVFGKYENPYFKFISNTIVKNILKLPIVINQNVYFDYLFVDDLVKIIEIFMNKKTKYKTYNVVTGKTIDLLTISKLINDYSDFKSKIKVLHQGLNHEYSAKNRRLEEEIGNFRFTPTRNSIKSLYNWYQKNIRGINKKKIIRDQYLKYIRINK